MPINIFFCYAHEDETLLKKLMQQLRPLQREGLIDTWHDRDISAGTEWEPQINQHLNNANIILLLISPDFIDSDYCYSIEMKRALERHKCEEARVIPIILRPVRWQGALGNLQALPKDAIPVLDQSWHNIDNAFFNVAESIRKVIQELLTKANTELEHAKVKEELQYHKAQDELKQTQVKELLAKGQALYKEKHYREAISNYSKIISLDPTYTNAYYYRGNTYAALNEYQKALADYDQALTHNPSNTNIYEKREEAVRALKEKQTQPQVVAEPKPVIIKQELPSQKSSSITERTTPTEPPSPHPAMSDIQALQKRALQSFLLIGALGFIGLIINIVQAVGGHSSAWWVWTSSVILFTTLFLGGTIEWIRSQGDKGAIDGTGDRIIKGIIFLLLVGSLTFFLALAGIIGVPWFNSLMPAIVTADSILFILGFITIVIGSARYVLSSGDQGAIASAKNTILYGCFAILIAVIILIAILFIHIPGSSKGNSWINFLMPAIVTADSILFILGFIMIVTSGIRYITSGGDPNKVGKAKTTAIYGCFAILIAIVILIAIFFLN